MDSKFAPPKFALPDDGAAIASLVLDAANEVALTPSRVMICINRGRTPLKEMFDARACDIPPGYFKVEYGAAKHFQTRLIVPGTRNLEVGGYVSYIGILGTEDGQIKVDDEANCQPFTDEELQTFGVKVEGIDRSSVEGSGRDVTLIRTATARAMSRSQGAGLKPQISANEQASPGAEEAAAHIFDPPAESDTRAAADQAAAHEEPAAAAGRRRR